MNSGLEKGAASLRSLVDKYRKSLIQFAWICSYFLQFTFSIIFEQDGVIHAKPQLSEYQACSFNLSTTPHGNALEIHQHSRKYIKLCFHF